MKIDVKHNIRLAYLYSICVNCFFLLPVLIPYYQDYIGLGFKDFLLGEAIFAATVIALEIPSGWLSDVWSRKKTLIIGSFFYTSGFLILLLADNLWDTILAQGILGIGVAFNSGTVTSIIYDSLVVTNKTNLYQKLEGKRYGFTLYAIAFASIIGGIIYQYNPYLPLMLDVAVSFMAGIFACFMIEPPRVKRATEKSPLHDMAVTIKYALHGHKEIAGIILVSTILFCSTKLFMWTQQPYMQFIEIPEKYFGYIIASGFVFGGLCGQYGHYIKIKATNRTVMLRLVVLTTCCGIMASFVAVPLSIIFILILSGVWGFGFPFIQNAINKYADPARRATILSTLGLLINLAFIPFSIILGWITDIYSIIQALLYVSLQLIIFGFIGLYIWTKTRSEK